MKAGMIVSELGYWSDSSLQDPVECVVARGDRAQAGKKSSINFRERTSAASRVKNARTLSHAVTL